MTQAKWIWLAALTAAWCMSPVGAQGEPIAHPEGSGAEVRAEGEPLVGLVLDVQGRAQIRAKASDDSASPPAWRTIERNMEIAPGATIRTGANTSVTLRLGLNATIRINSLARATLGELAQHASAEPPSLRTTIVLERGDMDVRVDHVNNFANDFAIVTQAATLAVRGTNFSVGVDGLDGLRVQGAETNSFRAIEVQYMDDTATALSQGTLDASWRQPALAALARSLEEPDRSVSTTDYAGRIGAPVTPIVAARVAGIQFAGVREIEILNVTANQVIESIGKGKDGPAPQGTPASER